MSSAVTDRILVRGFWGARQEDIDHLGDKWYDFFQLMSESIERPGDCWTSPDFGTVDVTSVIAVSNWVRQSISESIVADTPTLQFSLGLTGLDSKESVSIAARVGYAGNARKLLNAVVVTVDYTEPLVEMPRNLARLVEALAGIWQPDWAEASDRELRAMLGDMRPASVRCPRVGYVTYLSGGRAGAIADLSNTVLSRSFERGLILEFPPGERSDVRRLVMELDGELARSSALEELPVGLSVWR